MPKITTISPAPKLQADATISQANPVSGTKYTILNTTVNARILGVSLNVIWTVQPDPLEVWITIDGVVRRGYFANPVSNTDYHYVRRCETTTGDSLMSTTDPTWYAAFLEEGQSIKIEGEITGGTVQSLTARVKYAKW